MIADQRALGDVDHRPCRGALFALQAVLVDDILEVVDDPVSQLLAVP